MKRPLVLLVSLAVIACTRGDAGSVVGSHTSSAKAAATAPSSQAQGRFRFRAGVQGQPGGPANTFGRSLNSANNTTPSPSPSPPKDTCDMGNYCKCAYHGWWARSPASGKASCTWSPKPSDGCAKIFCKWDDATNCCRASTFTESGSTGMSLLVLILVVNVLFNLFAFSQHLNMEQRLVKLLKLLSEGVSVQGEVLRVEEKTVTHTQRDSKGYTETHSSTKYWVYYKFQLPDGRTVTCEKQLIPLIKKDREREDKRLYDLYAKKPPVNVLYDASDPTKCALKEICEMGTASLTCLGKKCIVPSLCVITVLLTGWAGFELHNSVVTSAVTVVCVAVVSLTPGFLAKDFVRDKLHILACWMVGREEKTTISPARAFPASE